MSDLNVKTSPPSRRRRPRWIKAMVGLTPLVLLVGAWLVLDHVAGDRLDKAIAEADRTDPRWRRADLWASRATTPDAENSACGFKWCSIGCPSSGWTKGLRMKHQHLKVFPSF